MMRAATHLLGITALLFAMRAARAQAPTPFDSIVTTHCQSVVSGKTLRYTVRAGLLPLLENDTGELMARMFFISYTVDRAPGDPPRPLTFLWNGGPGSNAAQLHVIGFGPKRVKTAETYPAWGANTETALVDNHETWLVSSDLVFVDPIGTGFSRATSVEYRDILYTTRGDAESVAEFIRLYRTRFSAWNAPVFIVGESYGTTRAMAVAEALEKRRHRLAGVVLMSGSFSVGERVPPELNQALQLSLYTATAHYHERLAPGLQALGQDDAVKEAVAWARTIYAPVLAKRDSATPAERAEVLAGLERFTSLKAADFDQRTLAISKDQFMDRLMADRGLELGRYDSRMSVTSRNPTTPWGPLLDPSLRPMIDLMQGSSRLFNSYVRDTLKYRSDLLYRGPFGEAFHPRPLATAPNGVASDWMTNMFNTGARAAAGTRPAGDADTASAPPLRRAMELNPKLRVMNETGIYDASCAQMDEAVARAEPALRSRITNRCYVGGHMMYSDLETRRVMQRDFADFVRSALGASTSKRAASGSPP